VAAYELLKRIAVRAGDERTVLMSDGILFDERAAAARVHSLFDHVLEASLEQAGAKA
jgi:ferritin-like metal-binding protein YciE